MKITAFNFYPIQKHNQYIFKPSFSQSEKDTVTFTNHHTIKKTDFCGFDLALIEKLKPNIQKFKNTEDLQNWAENEYQKILETDFGGRQPKTEQHRQEILKEWTNFFTINEKIFLMHKNCSLCHPLQKN